MNKRSILMIAALNGVICISLGAIAAHFLKEKISSDNLSVFDTGVRYQFYQTFALVVVAFMIEKDPSKYLKYTSVLFTAGIILFSFSLYFLSLRQLMGISNDEMRWVGAITPIGGISHIVGWLLIFVSAYKKRI